MGAEGLLRTHTRGKTCGNRNEGSGQAPPVKAGAIPLRSPVSRPGLRFDLLFFRTVRDTVSPGSGHFPVAIDHLTGNFTDFRFR